MIKPIELLEKVISGAKVFDRSLQTHSHGTVINTKIHELEESLYFRQFFYPSRGGKISLFEKFFPKS